MVLRLFSRLRFLVHVDVRHVPVVFPRTEAEQHDGRRPRQHGRDPSRRVPEGDADDASHDTRTRVNVLDKNIRHILRHDVAEQTATDPGGNAREAEDKHVGRFRFVTDRDPDDGEDRKTDGIEPEQYFIGEFCPVHAFFAGGFLVVMRFNEERDERNNRSCDGVCRTFKTFRRVESEDEVADDTAADGRCHGKHDDAEQVHSFPDPDHGPGDAECCDADDLYDVNECIEVIHCMNEHPFYNV